MARPLGFLMPPLTAPRCHLVSALEANLIGLLRRGLASPKEATDSTPERYCRWLSKGARGDG